MPKYSLPFWGWSVVGLAYYVIMAFVLYLFLSGAVVGLVGMLGLLATVVVLAANAAWNYVFFRVKDTRATAATTAVYVFLVCCLAVLVWLSDIKTGLVFSIYLLYIPYLLWWVAAVRRSNRSGA